MSIKHKPGLLPACWQIRVSVNAHPVDLWGGCKKKCTGVSGGERASAGPANSLGRRNGVNNVASSHTQLNTQAVCGEGHRAVLVALSSISLLLPCRGVGCRSTKQGLGLSVV